MSTKLCSKKYVFRFIHVCLDRCETRQKPSVWSTTERHDYNNNSAAIPAAYERAVGTETDERRGGGVVCSRTACRRLAGRPDPARPSPRPTHAHTSTRTYTYTAPHLYVAAFIVYDGDGCRWMGGGGIF